MKSRLRITHLANLCTISVICLQSGSVYIHLYTTSSEKSWMRLVRYGRSKSCKVVKIGTSRKSPYANYYYNPLYCDVMPIFLYRFRDTTILVDNLNCCCISHCSYVSSHRKGVPLESRV